MADVRKELTFCNKLGIRVIGIIENMSGYICPHCSECNMVFSHGGGERMAQEFGVRFLGKEINLDKLNLFLRAVVNRPDIILHYVGHIPIDPKITELQEQGKLLLENLPQTSGYTEIRRIVESIEEDIELEKKKADP